MNDHQRAALERAAEFAQERSRRNWNRIVEQAEQEVHDAETEVQERRNGFYVVDGESRS